MVVDAKDTYANMTDFQDALDIIKVHECKENDYTMPPGIIQGYLEKTEDVELAVGFIEKFK